MVSWHWRYPGLVLCTQMLLIRFKSKSQRWMWAQSSDQRFTEGKTTVKFGFCFNRFNKKYRVNVRKCTSPVCAVIACPWCLISWKHCAISLSYKSEFDICRTTLALFLGQRSWHRSKCFTCRCIRMRLTSYHLWSMLAACFGYSPGWM